MNFKYLFSVYKTTKVQFEPNLNFKEIEARLNDLVQARSFFPLFKAVTTRKNYIGDVSQDGFGFRKLGTGYSNYGVTAVAYGKVLQKEESVVVEVELMSASAIIYSFLFVALLCITLDFGYVLIDYGIRILQSPASFEPALLLLPIAWSFVVAMFYYMNYSYLQLVDEIVHDLSKALGIEPVQ